MKFTVQKAIFETTLNKIQPFLDKKEYEIMSNIFMETQSDAQNDFLVLKATDSELSIETKIDIKKESDGATIINGKEILKTIKALRDEEIKIEILDKEMQITQHTFQSNLAIFETNNFPKNFIEDSESIVNIDNQIFMKNIKKILPVIDQNNKKIAISGALLELKDYGLNFVATDTKRLSIVREKIQTTDNFSIIIPKRALNEIVKLFGAEKNFQILKTNSEFIIKSNSYIFTTKIINERFPDYEKIMPKDFVFDINLQKSQILEKINIIRPISEKIHMNFVKNKIIFSTFLDDSRHKATDELLLENELENNFSITFEARYLIDFINHIQTPDFAFLANDPMKPFMVKSQNFSTIILPIIKN